MKIDFQQLELFENWRPVPDWEGFYEVSDWGRVRSVARKVDYVGRHGPASVDYPGRLMIQDKKPNGYLCVLFRRQAKGTKFYVHRLVALAFIGPCPPGKEVDHIDGNRRHNHIKNLRYLKRSENRLPGILASRKLMDDQINEIRRLSLEGMTQSAIGKIFGVHSRTIGRIISRQKERAN